ncbi:MAG TPA: hypothetical protein V6D15_08230 [Oculatellaceae cyanobacterium]
MLIKNLFNSSLQNQVPLAGLLLSVGFVAISASPILASSVKPVGSSPTVAAATISDADRSVAANQKQLRDGIYLFGQTSKANQIGQEYVVFEARSGKVRGAVYMPSSEFSCFYGTANNNQMDLMVVDPYDQSTSSYSIGLERNSLVAGNNAVALQGYQPISKVTANDKRILNACGNK